MRMKSILPFFENLFNIFPEKKSSDLAVSSSGLPLSVESVWEGLKEKVDPVLKELKPPPPGPWATGELLPWLMRTILLVLKASRLFGQVLLQVILEDLKGLDRRCNEEGGELHCCPCPFCGSRVWAYEGSEMLHKAFKSIFGWVSLWRHYAKCRCGKKFFPLDTMLGLGRHKMLPFLELCCIYLGVYLSHRTATELLQLLTGIYVCPNTIRARVKEMGKAVIDRWKVDVTVEVEKLLGFASNAAGIVDLRAAMDGIMTPLNKLPKAMPESHKEVKMACLSVRNAEGKRLGRIVLGRLNATEVFLRCIERLLTDCRESMANLRKISLHADGALWIEKFARAQSFLTFILDWYHLKEKLWTLSEALGKGMTEHRQGKLKAIENSLWQGQVAVALERLRSLRFTAVSHREARDKVVQYIENRKEFIPNYKWNWERSFTIGSGEIEGAVKHVVANRLKNAGMRWSEEGADQTIAARCTILNQTWGIDLIRVNLN